MKSLRIPTHFGLHLAALLDAPTGPGPHPLVILLHGFTGQKEETHLATLATDLAAVGIAALRFDAPGSGESEGTATRDYRVSHYLAVVGDVRQYAVAHLPIDPQRIGLWGHSLGGLVALAATAASSHYQAVCGSQPASRSMTVEPAELETWRQTQVRTITMPGFGTITLPFDYYLGRNQVEANINPARITIPALLIAGTHDHHVSAESVKARYQAIASQTKDYQEFPVGHNYKTDPAQLAAINAITVAFFRQHLAK